MQHSTVLSTFFRSAAAIGLALSLFPGYARADTLIVEPAELSLSAVRPATDIVVRNPGSQEAVVNFEVRQWTQDNGRERLTPSTRLILHPERVNIKPGDVARIRVGLRLSGPRWEEEAFRIMVTETREVTDAGSPASLTIRRRVFQRADIPLFLRPPGRVNPRLRWSIERNPAGEVVLQAGNSGKAHVRLHSASLQGPGGHSIHKRNMSDYLLPGGTRTWVLAPDAAAGLWQLTADTNAGPMEARLELEPNMTAARALSLAP
ncbi:fimbrial biogenesis chaperone [Elongatibacter sediminis]|uniref:Fimbria/pilus periplasmic chaperone n=1 Tax=Elongatibacter sediminis TaxID=3119006 RepID=A0AAW9RHK7_9GAMM